MTFHRSSRTMIVAALMLGATLYSPRESAAYNWYYTLVKARHALTERMQTCVLCHTRAGSVGLNPFGMEFLSAGADAGALSLISAHDSDHDGVGNGVELRTGHFPGDATDVPAPAEVAAVRAGRAVRGDLQRELLETLQCPCCDKPVMACGCEMVPEIHRIVRQGVAAGRGSSAIKQALVARFGPKILPLRERTQTLPAGQFTARRVANAYRIAASIPREVEKYPCFCWCYRSNGHLSLLDCYKNEHGANCETCIEEAEIIEEMTRGGRREAEIRDRLTAQFGSHR